MEKTPTIVTVILGVLITLALTTSACVKQPAELTASVPDIVWPLPPEQPRVRFVKAVSRPEHLQILPGKFRRFFDYFSGKEATKMLSPYGIETDSAGRLFVVDTGLHSVHVFDAIANTYAYFPKNGTVFDSPIDIAIDNRNGRIFVSDSHQKVIKIFTNSGKTFVGEIGPAIFERPTGIAINSKTLELLVIDTLAANILRFDLQDLSLKGIVGSVGKGKQGLFFPTNIHVDPNGRIFVTDALNFRIQVFSPDCVFLSTFGGEGDQPGYFTRPRGVSTDSDGNIYVVDALFDNVQIFDKNHKLLLAFGNHGEGYGEFWLPTGIFIDRKDRIYVSDSYNKRIQIFEYFK